LTRSNPGRFVDT